MVIGYDMAPLSRILIGLMLRTDTVTLVNLVSETRSVPEFLGRRCQPGPMANALIRLLDDEDARSEQCMGRSGEAVSRTFAHDLRGPSCATNRTGRHV